MFIVEEIKVKPPIIKVLSDDLINTERDKSLLKKKEKKRGLSKVKFVFDWNASFEPCFNGLLNLLLTLLRPKNIINSIKYILFSSQKG